MADFRLRFPLLWVLFAAVMVAGASLLLSPDRGRQTLGLVLLGAPIILFSVVAGLYYLKERMTKRRGPPAS